jgi:hypothetical protein
MTKYTFKALDTIPGPSEWMLDGVDFGPYEEEAIISDSFNSSTYITEIDGRGARTYILMVKAL